MNYIVGENRNQIQMIALEQLVAPDSWARYCNRRFFFCLFYFKYQKDDK